MDAVPEPEQVDVDAAGGDACITADLNRHASDRQTGHDPQPPRQKALLAEYGEVANNFRLLTDIRFRLLAFLPIAAGTAAGLLAAGNSRDAASEMRALVLSVFGLVVTVALATYNHRNDQLYDTLISRGAAIERELELTDGAFANRPTEWFAPLRWKVSHRWPVTLIYGGSTALWLYSTAAAGLQLRLDGPASRDSLLMAAAGAFIATALAVVVVDQLRKARRRTMRKRADEAVKCVRRAGTERHKLAQCGAFVTDCARLGRIKPDKVRIRICYYTEPDQVERNRRYLPDTCVDEVDRAAAFVALLTDLPPELIADWHTGRRAS